MSIKLKEIDKIEILTLQDNYVDVAAFDGTEIVQRALPVKDMEIKNSILAEHGFSAIVTITADKMPRSLLFDFGFSEHGAAYNADALDLDLSTVEAMVLSHGHTDHFGCLEQLAERVGKKGIELVLHPTAFRTSRYIKVTEEIKIGLPVLKRERCCSRPGNFCCAAGAGGAARIKSSSAVRKSDNFLFIVRLPVGWYSYPGGGS